MYDARLKAAYGGAPRMSVSKPATEAERKAKAEKPTGTWK